MKNDSSTPALPPSVAVLQMLAGKWVSKAISVVSELSIADTLQRGPATPAELSRACGAHPQSLYRVLRALASVGVFAEDADGRFANTPLSETLRAGVPGSMRSMAIFFGNHPTWDAWGEFGHSVLTGEPSFERVHGQGYFDFMAAHPEEGRWFDDAMTGFSVQENDAIHAAFDFSTARTLVDIAGGHGALLISALQKNPAQRGILFDQPAVVEGAKRAIAAAGLAGRCEPAAGDFFREVPRGADGYVLKHILHDWSDAHAHKILSNIHQAAKGGAKLWVIDSVIDRGNSPAFAKLMDLEMLVLYKGGRERTEAEFKTLLGGAGFRLERVVPTQSSASVIEATRV